ncbi:MAG: pseudouridine synthase [Rivularia sp. (in: cyanobacteria)]
MLPLHPISDFINTNDRINNSNPTYYYQGYSPDGELLQLPRTQEAELIARGLMQQLANNEIYTREGKMYGILLVELPSGAKGILKAFSGLLNGSSIIEGWVPPIPGREKVVLEESRTLAELEAIKQLIIQLKQLAQRKQFEIKISDFEQRLQEMGKRHQVSKQQRHQKRQLLYKSLIEEELNIELEKLKEESRRDGIERKLLKRQRDQILQPLQIVINNADIRIRELKQQRKQISRNLQAQMHKAYSIMNFLGNTSSLQQLMPQLPTGTGDCCAPKLLHYAAINKWKPLAIAEFWWGESTQDKIAGEFYGACVERCQPLMGFLLSGLKSDLKSPSPTRGGVWGEVPIIYEDEWLIAVNKPSGLLSVPGRYLHNQDSVVSRLDNLLSISDGEKITAVHRLDMDTSGILLLAKNQNIYRLISKQFEQKLVSKIYEAVLSGNLTVNQGSIELPIWGNPENRPYQEVNYQYGKPCITKFKVVNKLLNKENYTRIEFIPLTGRTHQLRVHAADTNGLGMPILGDKLYGYELNSSRLHLHARELSFEHPYLEEKIYLKTEVPF